MKQIDGILSTRLGQLREQIESAHLVLLAFELRVGEVKLVISSWAATGRTRFRDSKLFASLKRSTFQLVVWVDFHFLSVDILSRLNL